MPAGDRLGSRHRHGFAARLRLLMMSSGRTLTLKVLLTHTPEFRRQYYGERSLKGLQAVARVVLHEADDALDAAGLIGAARDVVIIVAAPFTEGHGENFPRLQKLQSLCP
jgi:D-3-phosphoglycerate dehydrogenase